MQQEDNRTETNWDDDGDSQKRRPDTPEGVSSDILKEMKKEMDELRNAIKEKTDWRLDRMVKRTTKNGSLSY